MVINQITQFPHERIALRAFDVALSLLNDAKKISADDDAIKYLQKALLLGPNSIDTNYFSGELMYDKRRYKNAK